MAVDILSFTRRAILPWPGIVCATRLYTCKITQWPYLFGMRLVNNSSSCRFAIHFEVHFPLLVGYVLVGYRAPAKPFSNLHRPKPLVSGTDAERIEITRGLWRY